MRALGLGFGLLVIASMTACSGTTTGTGGNGGGSSSGSSSPGSSSSANDGTDTTTSGGDSSFSSGTSNPSDPSGPSAYDALFDAPANKTSTPGSIYGLWAGSKGSNSADVRVQLASSKVTIAMRCGAQPAKGVEVSAQVTSTTIKILASKLSGNADYEYCGVKVTPVSIPRCKSTDEIGCFTIQDSTLSFVGMWLFSSEGYGPDPDFTKLSD